MVDLSMTPNTPSSPVPPAAIPPKVPRKRRWVLIGCGSIVALVLIIFATVAITLWWIQRPIKPVTLTNSEKAAVEAKLRQAQGGTDKATAPTSLAERPTRDGARTTSPGTVIIPDRNAELVELPHAPLPAPGEGERARPYVPGSKVLKLTEREINGLLNANTELGRSVRLEFDRDAINAYVAVPIPKDFPIGGGRMFRARGRFQVSLGNGGAPCAILEDVTVFGLSLPKAWLGGLKGENLIGTAMGERSGPPTVLKGIKSLRVEPGALVLEVGE